MRGGKRHVTPRDAVNLFIVCVWELMPDKFLQKPRHDCRISHVGCGSKEYSNVATRLLFSFMQRTTKTVW